MANPFETARAEYLRLKNRRDEIDTEHDEIEERMDELEEFFRIAKTVAPDFKFPFDEKHERPKLKLKSKINTKDAVVAAAERMLAGGKALPTRAILAELVSQGIQVGGKTEKHRILHVSSILNRSERFVADRAKGWTLRIEQLELPKGEARGARTLRASIAALSR